MKPALAILAVAAALVAGCQYPRDPDATLDTVSGGTMRVGVSEAEPWVELDEQGEPTGGVEVELVRRFAREVGARRVEWVDGSEEELVNAMRRGALDLVIGGVTSKTRWKKDVAPTWPYVETETVVGIPRGASVRDGLAGERVSVEQGTEAEELAVAKLDAEVEPVEELAGAGGYVVAEDYVLDDLELQQAGSPLKKEKHVMLVPFGENAWMVRLERFLLAREAEIERLVREEGGP